MKISVVIATVNRRDELRETLLAYRRQTYRDIELVVIDNGSTDGTAEMMQGEFPDAVYERLPYNMGTHAINIGFERAAGDVFWLSNNDSYPEDSQALAMVVSLLTQFPAVDIIGSEDIEVRDNNRVYQWHPAEVDKTQAPEDGFPTVLFHGTGAAVRRRVVEAIGGFWDVFVFEELDFCARAIAAGYNLRYVPAIRTLHFASPRQRAPIERWIASSKNLVRYFWRHFPFGQALWKTIAYMGYFIVQGIAYRARPSAFIDVILGMAHSAAHTFRTERRPLPKAVIRQITMGEHTLKPMLRYGKEALQRRLHRRKNTS